MADNLSNDQFKELSKTLQQLGIPTQQLKIFTEQLRQAGTDSEKVDQVLQSMGDRVLVLKTRFDSAGTSARDLASMLAEQISDLSTASNILGRQKSMYNSIASVNRDIALDAVGALDLNKRDLANRLQKLETMEAEFAFQSKLAAQKIKDIKAEIRAESKKAEPDNKKLKRLYQTQAELETIADFNAKESVEIQGVIGNLEKRSTLEGKISKTVGVTGALVEGTGAFMERLGMRSGIFHDAMEASAKTMRAQGKLLNEQVDFNVELVEENNKQIEFLEKKLEKGEDLNKGEAKLLKRLKDQNKELKTSVTFNDKLNIAVDGAAKLAKGFGAALGDPALVVAAIGKGFLDVNKAATEAQRYSGEYNSSLQGGFSTLASTKDVLEATVELTKELGMSANLVFSGKMLANAAELKNTMGLAGKEAAGLALQAKTTGQSMDGVVDSTVEQVNSFNRANRSAVNHRIIIEDVATASDSIRASVSSFPGGLAKAASAARRLGMSLSDIDSIAGSMLNFESSIEAELEAQLLTGKDINMAKARELALNNELGKLGDELFKNSSDIAEFGKMNRIQQEAQAKALGMTRDQLARVAYMKALENGLTDEAAAKAAGVTAESMKQMDIQAKIAKAIEKLQQAFAPILDVVVDIVDALAPVISIVGGLIGKILGLLKTLYILKPVVVGLMAAFAAKAVINNLSDMGTKLGEITQGAKDAGKAIMGFFKKGGVTKATESIKGYKNTFMEAFSAVKGAKGKGGIKDDITKSVTDKVKDSVKDSVPDDAGKGIGGLTDTISKIDIKKVLAGAAAMVIVAGAVFIFAKATQEFMEVSWSAVGKAIVGLSALVLAVAAIGAIMMSGVGAVAILAGAAAMFVMAGALYVLGKAMQLFNDVNYEGIGQLGSSFISLAKGLAVLSTSIFTSLPAIAILGTIATMGTGLMNAGSGIKAMAEGVAKLSEALQSLETSKLEEVKDLISSTALAAPAIAATGAITSLIQGIAGTGGGSDDPVVAKIQELIDLVGSGKVVELKLDSETISKQQMLSMTKGK